MSAPSKRSGPDGTDTETILLWVGIGAVVAVLGVMNVAVHVGRSLDGLSPLAEKNPLTLPLSVIMGKTEWTNGSTIVALLAAIVLAALGTAGYLIVRSFSGNKSPLDRAAQYLGRGKRVHDVTEAGVKAKAVRLGVECNAPGVFLGNNVADGVRLFTSWEDVSVCIAGPRTGKTTSLVIPTIADAPGAVVTTSNKRDVVDATRELRNAVGKTWVFDPQGVADESATWWWNPLSYITDEVKAQQLARLFSDAARKAGDRRDPFFDGSGDTLLAALLLAAMRANRKLSAVHEWLSDDSDDEAVALLQEAGDHRMASSLRQIIQAPAKQKGGVYGTAQNVMSFLNNDEALRWVETSGPGDSRPQLSMHEFVRSTDTLYSLSKEGVGSAGPLVTALTVAVTEAAEDYAKTQRGGRLTVPMILVLDEAANVCRWNNLPDLYSHYGSRGITIFTILQSWSQGVEVWGQDGMRKLWTAANAKIYLGGVDEPQFLSDLSQLVGEFERTSRSVSYSSGGTSRQLQSRSERILDTADLRAVPRGRAILLYSGIPPILMRTVPWQSGHHAEKITAALATHMERTAA